MSTHTITQHRNAKDRLLAVADKIESTPSEWDQATWSDSTAYTGVLEATEMASCGAFGCAAGWGTAATPTDQLLAEIKRNANGYYSSSYFGFEEAGAFAFGIHEDVADRLFMGSFGMYDVANAGEARGPSRYNSKEVRAERMVKALRHLAAMPWEKRRRACRLAEIEDICEGRA